MEDVDDNRPTIQLLSSEERSGRELHVSRSESFSIRQRQGRAGLGHFGLLHEADEGMGLLVAITDDGER